MTGDKFSNKGDEFRKSLNASDKLIVNSTKTIYRQPTYNTAIRRSRITIVAEEK
jgi:hypothetical protein